MREMKNTHTHSYFMPAFVIFVIFFHLLMKNGFWPSTLERWNSSSNEILRAQWKLQTTPRVFCKTLCIFYKCPPKIFKNPLYFSKTSFFFSYIPSRNSFIIVPSKQNSLGPSLCQAYPLDFFFYIFKLPEFTIDYLFKPQLQEKYKINPTLYETSFS